MYQKINRNSMGQFMRTRNHFFHVSAMPQVNEIKDKAGVVHKIVTWIKSTFVKEGNKAKYNKGKLRLKAV